MHRVGVVAVVGNHGRARIVHDIETARRIVAVGRKAGQGASEGVPVQVDSPGRRHRGHDVFDLKADGAAARERNVGQRDALDPRAFSGHQHGAIDKHCALALCPMCSHQRMMAVSRKKNHLAGANLGHVADDAVGGIEHCVAAGRDVLHNHALEHGQVFHRGDVVQPQVVAAANVGDHRHLAAVKAQAFAQHAATRDFKHRRIDIRVHQHIARAFWPAAVAAVGLPAIDIHAVGVGHAGAQALGSEQVGNQAGGGGFAVGAGHRNHRNPAVVAGRKKLIHDGSAHSAALAIRRRQVHAQAGRGIHLNHAAVLVLQGPEHAFAHHIDAANVQANHLRSSHGLGGNGGMHFVGHIGGGAASA